MATACSGLVRRQSHSFCASNQTTARTLGNRLAIEPNISATHRDLSPPSGAEAVSAIQTGLEERAVIRRYAEPKIWSKDCHPPYWWTQVPQLYPSSANTST